MDVGDAMRRLPSFSCRTKRLKYERLFRRASRNWTLCAFGVSFLAPSPGEVSVLDEFGSAVVQSMEIPEISRPLSWVFTIYGCWRRDASPSIFFLQHEASKMWTLFSPGV